MLASGSSATSRRERLPGGGKVVLLLETSDGLKTLELGPGYRVARGPDVYAGIKALLGDAAIR